MAQIGKILVAKSIISAEQLSIALSLQTNSGSRLGDIIIAQGMATYFSLYSAVAEHYNLPFIDLLKNSPAQELLCADVVDKYLKYQAIPWKIQGDTTIIAVSEICNETNSWIHSQYGKNIELVITSPLDIRRTVERVFGVTLEEKSCFELWQETPELSARMMIAKHNKPIFYFCIIFILAILTLFPQQFILFIVASCSIVYFFDMFIKTIIFTTGSKKSEVINWQIELAKLDDKTLPIYTILIPMYREVAVLPKMLDALKKLDYPSEKLDIKIILELDDAETYSTALALKPTYNFEIIRIPYSVLKTKPKACNYAVRFARGEYITIFDADDIPETLQLKKAIYSFRNSDKNVACVQARLNYYNADYNWLTRFFSIEYSILFEVMLLGLERLNIVLPLGGTSNHLSLEHLRQLGSWDPFNVTEDADLGVRLCALGYRTKMLDSLTMEEATADRKSWTKQRSRWIKGYMQTWLVHIRHPIKLYKSIGFMSFFGFHFFVGFSSFIFLTAPLMWSFAIGCWVFPEWFFLPDWLLYLTLNNLFLNFTIHWTMVSWCLIKRQKTTIKMKIMGFLYPLYLLLHSIASYKALYQLIVRPHFWEKTTHGIAME